MDLKTTFELGPFTSGECNTFLHEEYDCNSKIETTQHEQAQSSSSKNVNYEPSCKRVKRSSALLRRSITNFNGYYDRTISSTENSTETQRNLNECFEKAFDAIQLSSGPPMTSPIVILTDLTAKCIKSRRLI